jgi:hypothetical protein
MELPPQRSLPLTVEEQAIWSRVLPSKLMDSLEAAEPVCFSLRPLKLAREVMLCSVGERAAHRLRLFLPGNLWFALATNGYHV